MDMFGCIHGSVCMIHDEPYVLADGLSNHIALVRQEEYVHDAESLLSQHAEERATIHFELPLHRVGIQSAAVDSVHVKWILKHYSQDPQPEALCIILPHLVAAGSTLVVLGGGVPRLCLNLAGSLVVNQTGCINLNSDLHACSSVMKPALLCKIHQAMNVAHSNPGRFTL